MKKDEENKFLNAYRIGDSTSEENLGVLTNNNVEEKKESFEQMRAAVEKRNKEAKKGEVKVGIEKGKTNNSTRFQSNLRLTEYDIKKLEKLEQLQLEKEVPKINKIDIFRAGIDQMIKYLKEMEND